jgi:formylglycine-generating enzyme required for sulfatase activity
VATVKCAGSACTVASCNTGFGDCDGSYANGCEVDTKTDARNCGSCAVACGGGQSCIGGTCVTGGPSCVNLAATCGPSGNDSCCTSSVVLGGSYYRSYDVAGDASSGSMAYPATVQDFRLEKYLVTVGRFRSFVAAVGAGWRPANGAGANPFISGSGWNYDNLGWPDISVNLTANLKCDPLFATWTDTAGANENLPISCVDWYEAFAFCTWDGGFLPTEAEWNYAAAGGNAQAAYPWTWQSPAANTTIDSSYAVYNCPAGCNGVGDFGKVGSKSPKGDGRWGQSDLAGNVFEWTLDWFASYATPCADCANLATATERVVRGGSVSRAASNLRTAFRLNIAPATHDPGIGLRCARTK